MDDFGNPAVTINTSAFCALCGNWIDSGTGHSCRVKVGGSMTECAICGSSTIPCRCGFTTFKPPPVQGIKNDTGKPAIDLIDPYFIEDVAQVLTFGANKYSVDNWKNGMSLGKALGGVLRHTWALLRGEYTDPETGISHAAHATCGLMFVHFFIRNGMLSVPDDRWKKTPALSPPVDPR